MEKELIFNIPRKYIINANQQMHHMAKANNTIFLKKMGYNIGYENLPEKEKELIQKRKEIIDLEDKNKILRSRITKQIKKENPTLTTKEIVEKREQLILEQFGKIDPEIKSSDIKINPLFNYFTIEVEITTPTARRYDPPNLYQTVKGLVDGLTYCGYWDDDDWEHIQSMSFKGNQNSSNTKDLFIFKLTIKEIKK